MNKLIGKINILGTEYKIYLANEKSDKVLEGKNGDCDWTKKKLVLDYEASQSDPFKIHVLTHEIVHAHLHEAGLRGQGHSGWAEDEEIVDWIASMVTRIMSSRKSMIEIYKKATENNDDNRTGGNNQ